jgi:hypothetical protein
VNQLTTATRSGNATVAGISTSPATNVTMNTLSALVYGDSTFPTPHLLGGGTKQAAQPVCASCFCFEASIL